ncbi:MAG: hypothetical protein KDE24_32005, partial [Caldilinea sp.]|nr:hypothetical protein [Caldilinea sp.]
MQARRSGVCGEAEAARMPELPELEVVCEVLNRRVAGQVIEHVEVLPPGGAIVVRDYTRQGLAAALEGHSFE